MTVSRPAGLVNVAECCRITVVTVLWKLLDWSGSVWIHVCPGGF